MQRVILSKKNQLTAISGTFILFGFISRIVLGNMTLWKGALIIASLLGIAPIAIQAYQSMKVKVVSIDVLVTLAVAGAFFVQNFEESAIVTFLFLFGAYLEQRTLNQTRSAIKELTDMAPDRAVKRGQDGEWETVDVEEVNKGDILLVKTGAKVPVDGTVIVGEGHINEASITGEAVSVGKTVSSQVFAGTILEDGALQIRTDHVGEDTTFGKIIELVEEAQDSKSETERFIDRFSKVYTPAVLVLALIVWFVSKDIHLAITLLVLGCPGALVIGVPVSNVAGIGNGARNGVLLKGSEVLHDLSKVDTVVFDKTGTLTEGNPRVAEKRYFEKDTEKTLAYLASIERESDHPLAKAVLKEIGQTDYFPVEGTEVIKGGGIVANVEGQKVVVGNLYLMEKEQVRITQSVKSEIEKFENNGHSIVLSAVEGELKVLMGIRDQIRSGVKRNLQRLKKLGVKNLVVLSGDNQGTVNVIARELGLTEAYGQLLPQEKADFIKKLQNQGKVVAFVGDGVNDSPSLAVADVGVAMGSGTDVAIETADVVLMQSDFSRLPHALGLTKATARNMTQNITIAIGVVLFLMINVFFSDWMNMAIGMLVHEGSILVVIFNAMRLRNFQSKEKNKPNKSMKKIAETAPTG